MTMPCSAKAAKALVWYVGVGAAATNTEEEHSVTVTVHAAPRSTPPTSTGATGPPGHHLHALAAGCARALEQSP